MQNAFKVTCSVNFTIPIILTLANVNVTGKVLSFTAICLLACTIQKPRSGSFNKNVYCENAVMLWIRYEIFLVRGHGFDPPANLKPLSVEPSGAPDI